MLKALLKKQLLELCAFVLHSRRTGRRRSAAAMIGFGVLAALLVLLFLFSFGAMAYPLCAVLAPLGLGWLYFASMCLTALAVSVVAGAFMSHSILFAVRDNALLFSLPIPPGMILGVRLAGLYLADLAYLLLVLLPAEAVYAVLAPRPLGALLCAAPVALLLAGVAAALSCLLGWVVAALSARVRHKSAAVVLLSLCVLALYLLGYQALDGLLSGLIQQARQLASQPGAQAGPLFVLGRAACGDAGALGLVVLAVLPVLAVCVLALARRYPQLATAEHGAAKAVYHERAARQNSLPRALLERELRRLGASAPYLLNAALGTLMLPAVGLAALWQAGPLRAAFVQMPAGAAAPLLCAVVCMVSCTNLLTAPSVSLEGRTLWQLQSLPVPPWQVLRAKLALHLLLTLPSAAFCVACLLWLAGAAAGESLLALAVVALFVLFCAQLGLVCGLRWPNLHWTSEVVVIKQGLATTLTLLGSWALVAAAGLLSLPLGRVFSFTGCLGVWAAVLLAADLLLHRWLHTRGTAAFAAL